MSLLNYGTKLAKLVALKGRNVYRGGRCGLVDFRDVRMLSYDFGLTSSVLQH